jgi:antitoxin component of MazEF toxin-antitoxin module
MKTTLKRWGNSLAVRIPKSILNTMGLKEGMSFEIDYRSGVIVLTPVLSKVREGWAEAAKAAHQNGNDKVWSDFSNEFDEGEW